ncbi:MAG: TIM barrel protein [Phycisphaerales bacterium]|nr:MAG: TIM barrel protein [Phycisphaerales bacterium]
MERHVLYRLEPSATATGLQERLGRIVAAGFDGIELPLGPAHTRETADGTVPMDVRAVSELPVPTRLASGGLQVKAVAARCHTCDTQAALRELSTLINRAAEGGAQCLNLMIPPLARSRGDQGFTSYQTALNFAYELLHGARFEAEVAGVVLALEAGANGCLLSPVELRQVIDAANSWAVGACIDVARIGRIGSPADWLRTLTARVHSVRVDCTRPADRPASTKPDDIDFAAITEALDDIRYDRIVIAAGLGDPAEIRSELTKLGCPIPARLTR